MALIPPTKTTLQKYGLSLDEWQAMADAQGHRCYICRQEPSKGRLCVDHFHAKGWKKMPPEQRKLYVRALLCWTCNHYYMGRGITVEKAKNVVACLEAFEVRRPPEPERKTRGV